MPLDTEPNLSQACSAHYHSPQPVLNAEIDPCFPELKPFSVKPSATSPSATGEQGEATSVVAVANTSEQPLVTSFPSDTSASDSFDALSGMTCSLVFTSSASKLSTRLASAADEQGSTTDAVASTEE
ncbi:uncharacterized protein G2W53_005644 [Senna tora]|uniref:Uncharacterized protein n=1 Tax=Senna tora TaxID=362788 RepID=A0A834X3X6_9FABA|nr:uncharacterized protein G2W53_005644 [Senna tora]